MATGNWARIVNTTINEYLKGAEVNVLRNRKLLAKLRSAGRVSMGHSGLLMDWKVRFKQTPMAGYADSDTLTFARQNKWKTAQLDWRGYAGTDSMTKREKLQNKSTEAIVKVYSEIAANLMEDMEEQFGDEFYVDGNASNNTKRIHGLESFFSVSGAGTKSPIGKPNDVYAGLTCTLGNYGGAWSSTGTTAESPTGDWPSGTGDAHFDFWAPLVVDYTSAVATSSANGTTGWVAGTKTWPNTCLEAMRFGIIKGKKNRSKSGAIDLILLNDELYRQFMDKVQAEENLHVTRGDSKDGLYALGFADVLNFDGVDVSYEYGIPATVGYGMATGQMELCSLQDQLFVAEGPDYDIAGQSHRFSIDFAGNLKIKSPRHYFKLDNVS